MTQDLERGIDVKSSAIHEWALLYEEWILCVERYCRLEPKDAPYCYTERANIGVLASAAWRCGWIALEEFHYEKTDGDRIWSGRLDLWLRSASNRYHVEGKQVWPNLGATDLTRTVAENLDLACEDATRFVLDEAGPRLGSVFCTPWVNAGSEGEVDKLIARFLLGIEHVPHSARAWCFPKVSRKLQHEKMDLPGNRLDRSRDSLMQD